MVQLNRPQISFGSPEWAKVEEWLAEELLQTYRRLSNPNTDERETNQLRGRAGLLSQMLEFRNFPAAPSR